MRNSRESLGAPWSQPIAFSAPSRVHTRRPRRARPRGRQSTSAARPRAESRNARGPDARSASPRPRAGSGGRSRSRRGLGFDQGLETVDKILVVDLEREDEPFAVPESRAGEVLVVVLEQRQPLVAARRVLALRRELVAYE